VCSQRGTNCVFKYVQFRLDLVPTCVWFVEDQVTLDCFSVGAAWNASTGTSSHDFASDHGTQRAGPSEGVGVQGPNRL